MSPKVINTGRYESATDFWAGELVEKSVTIYFGKIGARGIRATREFSTTVEAEEFLNSRLQGKVESGFKPI